MSNPQAKFRIDPKAFLEDFARGMTDEELCAKFSIDRPQLRRVLATLKTKGLVSAEINGRRAENLKIRFGDGNRAEDRESAGAAAVDLDTGLVLHCPSCGASVERGAKKCGYCGSFLDFSLKGKTILCAHCYQRNPADGRFCIVCGRPAKKQSEQAEVLEDRLCPACNAAMLLVSIADFSAIGCKACSGLFLTHETFEMMQDSQQRVIESTRAGSPTAAIGATRITYVRCPVCRTLMNRKNFAAGSGVILDVCGRHGTWFDGGELEKIMDFIARGGLAKARAIELEEKKHELYLQRLRKETPEPGGFDPGICEPSSSILTGGGSDLFVDLVGGLIKILKNH